VGNDKALRAPDTPDHYDIGIAVPARALQLDLDFAAGLRELFAGTEMGEDALRVLNEIIPLRLGCLNNSLSGRTGSL
jgi:hypothetical protein